MRSVVESLLPGKSTLYTRGWNKRTAMDCPMANVLATDSPLVSPPLHFPVFRPTNRIIREAIQISLYLEFKTFFILTRDRPGYKSSKNCWRLLVKDLSFIRRKKYSFETQYIIIL